MLGTTRISPAPGLLRRLVSVSRQHPSPPKSAPIRSRPGQSLPPSLVRPPSRSLHTTIPRSKKAKNSRTKEPPSSSSGPPTSPSQSQSQSPSSTTTTTTTSSSSSSSSFPPADPSDPLNFADVRARIAKQTTHYQGMLKTLTGTEGRFNMSHLAALRVTPDRKNDPGTSYALRELAQIVTRGGRAVSILANEASFVKPIMSAVQAAPDFNQQPQRAEDNELELVMKVEAESREEVSKRIKAACHEWREKVRGIRRDRDKMHDGWAKQKAIVPDLKRRADGELEKIVKGVMGEIDKGEKEVLKGK